MPRSERQVPSVYFGRPGALVTLPWPRGDVEKPFNRQAFDFLTGSGQHFISLLTSGARSHALHWNALHIDSYNLLAQYWYGTNGTGPWAYIDPSAPNLLLPNQASATNTCYDTTGFSTSAADNGTPVSNTSSTYIHRTGGQRSLRWQFTVAAATSPELLFAVPYRNWFGIPAVTGLPYTFSFWIRTDGVIDSAITASARIRWYDSAGALLSESTGGNIATNNTFAKLTCTATAPANTAYMRPVVIATGSTITTGGSLYLDEFLLEQDSVANNWAAGAGVRAVEITSLTDIVPFETRMRRGIDMTLQELAS